MQLSARQNFQNNWIPTNSSLYEDWILFSVSRLDHWEDNQPSKRKEYTKKYLIYLFESSKVI